MKKFFAILSILFISACPYYWADDIVLMLSNYDTFHGLSSGKNSKKIIEKEKGLGILGIPNPFLGSGVKQCGGFPQLTEPAPAQGLYS
jgi:hypothetical protein